MCTVCGNLQVHAQCINTATVHGQIKTKELFNIWYCIIFPQQYNKICHLKPQHDYTFSHHSSLALIFNIHSTSVLPQWHAKDPGHSASSAGACLQLNIHTSLTQWSRSGLTVLLARHSVGIKLVRNLSGDIQPQLSQHALSHASACITERFKTCGTSCVSSNKQPQ